jgi:hypothetical protein
MGQGTRGQVGSPHLSLASGRYSRRVPEETALIAIGHGVTTMTKVSDSTVRRAAKRVGLAARKSRWRRIPGSIDNYGEYMLIEPLSSTIVSGTRSQKFAMTGEDVVAFCNRREEGQ